MKIEELKAAVENGISVDDDLSVYIKLSVEESEALSKLIDKDIPELVHYVGDHKMWFCPTCGEPLDYNNLNVGRCSCGKALIFDRKR